jgi:hypothetical protein
MGTAGMVSHDFQQFVLGFGADHEIAIGPCIPAADLSVNFASHDQNPPSSYHLGTDFTPGFPWPLIY